MFLSDTIKVLTEKFEKKKSLFVELFFNKL